jgi:hypothetical protein
LCSGFFSGFAFSGFAFSGFAFSGFAFRAFDFSLRRPGGRCFSCLSFSCPSASPRGGPAGDGFPSAWGVTAGAGAAIAGVSAAGTVVCSRLVDEGCVTAAFGRG